MKALTEPTTLGASGGEGPTKAQILPVHKRVSFVFIDCHRFLIENLQFELGLENNPLFADERKKKSKSIKINSETCASVPQQKQYFDVCWKRSSQIWRIQCSSFAKYKSSSQLVSSLLFGSRNSGLRSSQAKSLKKYQTWAQKRETVTK